MKLIIDFLRYLIWSFKLMNLYQLVYMLVSEGQAQHWMEIANWEKS